MVQRLISGDGYIDSTGTGQRLIAGVGYVYDASAAISPSADIGWTEGSETVEIGANVSITGVTIVTAWTEGSEVVSVAVNSVSGTGTITTPVMKNNTGTILANETGVIVNVYSATTGVLVVHKTGQTSSSGGIVTVVDALIIPATLYSYEVVLTSNGRRLPTATAT